MLSAIASTETSIFSTSHAIHTFPTQTVTSTLRQTSIGPTVTRLTTRLAQNTPIQSATFTPTQTTTPMSQASPNIATQLSDIQTEIIVIQEEMYALQATMLSISSYKATEPINELDSIDVRLTVIEQIILNNPERALQLAFISNDLSDLKSSYQSDYEDIEKEIDRLIEDNRSDNGLIITTIIGVISLAASNIISRSEIPSKLYDKLGKKDKSQSDTSGK